MVYTTHENGDLGEGLWHCFTRIKLFSLEVPRFRYHNQIQFRDMYLINSINLIPGEAWLSTCSQAIHCLRECGRPDKKDPRHVAE